MKQYKVQFTDYMDIHVNSGPSLIRIDDISSIFYMNDCSIRNCTTEESYCIYYNGNGNYINRICFHRNWSKDLSQSIAADTPNLIDEDNIVEEATISQCSPNGEGRYGITYVWEGKISFKNNNISYNKISIENCMVFNFMRVIPLEFVNVFGNTGNQLFRILMNNQIANIQTYIKWNILNNTQSEDTNLRCFFYSRSAGQTHKLIDCVLGFNIFDSLQKGENVIFNVKDSYFCSDTFGFKGKECIQKWTFEEYRPIVCIGSNVFTFRNNVSFI